MNKTIFKQLNSKWSNLPYPTKSSSFGGNGCGCCACTHIAIEQPWKADWTPDKLRKWMIKQGYAVANQGTTWNGITETLKHIGHSKVVRIWDDPMSEAWKELNKGNRIGIILFNNNTAPNGTVWTASGHYVAFTQYRYKNKLHQFYCKDSGGRNHDGWYSYETSMKNCIAKMWIVQRLEIKAVKYRPTTPYTGLLPKISVKKGIKSRNVIRLKRFLNWCIGSKLNDSITCGESTDKAIRRYQKTYGLTVDGIFGPASKAKAQQLIATYSLERWFDALKIQYEWSKNQEYKFDESPTVANSKYRGTCITFPAVALQRIGLLPQGKYFYLYPKTMKIAGNGASYIIQHPEFYLLSYPNKTVAELGSNLKIGDICGFGNPAYHTMIFKGKNSKGQPIWDTMGHRKGLNVTYPYYANRKINMIVRLKKTK